VRAAKKTGRQVVLSSVSAGCFAGSQQQQSVNRATTTATKRPKVKGETEKANVDGDLLRRLVVDDRALAL